MKTISMKHLRLGAFLSAALLASISSVRAEPAGMIKTSQGSASTERNGKRIPATVGTTIETGDRIVTGADGMVGITLRDNTMLTAGPNSILDLSKFAFDTTTHAGTLNATVKKGVLSVISGKLVKANPNAASFSTPNATLGVRGTEFIVEAGQPEE